MSDSWQHVGEALQLSHFLFPKVDVCSSENQQNKQNPVADSWSALLFFPHVENYTLQRTFQTLPTDRDRSKPRKFRNGGRVDLDQAFAPPIRAAVGFFLPRGRSSPTVYPVV